MLHLLLRQLFMQHRSNSAFGQELPIPTIKAESAIKEKSMSIKHIQWLEMRHMILDDQIDELERKHVLPDTQEEKMIAELKKERLKVRDEIEQSKQQHNL